MSEIFLNSFNLFCKNARTNQSNYKSIDKKKTSLRMCLPKKHGRPTMTIAVSYQRSMTLLIFGPRQFFSIVWLQRPVVTHSFWKRFKHNSDGTQIINSSNSCLSIYTEAISLTTHQDILMKLFSYKERLQSLWNYDNFKNVGLSITATYNPIKVLCIICVFHLSDFALPLLLRSLLWCVLLCSSNNQSGNYKIRITLVCKDFTSYSSFYFFFLCAKCCHEEPSAL